MSPRAWLYAGAGLVLVTVGLVALLLPRRRAAVLAFGVSVASLGFIYEIFAFFIRDHQLIIPPAWYWVALIFLGAGLWGMVILFPRPLRREDAVDAVIALVAGGAYVGARIAIDSPYFFSDYVGLATSDAVPIRVGTVFVNVAAGTALILYALRCRRADGTDPAFARSLGILSVGIMLFSAGNEIRAAAREEVPAAYGFVEIGFLLLVAALWVLATRGAHSRIARNVALAAVIIPVASLFLSASAATYVNPVGRLLGALFLGYAVLRGQIDGLDVKVRFAISKSTIAATFIAVFFVASALAQQFFSDKLGGTYVGIVAAGLLVFAISPLQRAAERLAEKAVPIGTETARVGPTLLPHASEGKEEAYRAALRVALRGKPLTREEEVGLAHLSDELGLTHKRAREIWHEVDESAAPLERAG